MKNHLQLRAAARISRRSRQRGVATLVVVMVLFFIISLVAAYTSRNLIFEQRTASNQYRSTLALETAEAGLEWAISMLNFGRITGACAASTNNADTTFRQRYLNVDATGRIAANTLAGGGDLTPACVFNGDAANPGWNCACPSTTPPSLTVAATNDLRPAFKVRFQRVLLTDAATGAARQPGVVRVQVVGCTRFDAGDCLNFDGQSALNEGRARLTATLALAGSASGMPQAALTARGDVNIAGAGYAAYNSGAGASGITVQAGGDIDTPGATTLVGSVGSPGGTATILRNEISLSGLSDLPITGQADYSKNDRMFSAIFNARPGTFRKQQAMIELACPCTVAQVRTAAALNPGRPIWVAGDLIGSSAGDVGSLADPILLVVNGNLQFTVAGVNIIGLVYVRLPAGATAWDSSSVVSGQITGATVAENDITGTSTNTYAYDLKVMDKLRWNTGSFVRVPSSWKDYR